MVFLVLGDVTVAVGRLLGGALLASVSAACAALLVYAVVVPLAGTARETARAIRHGRRAARARREAEELRRAYARRFR